MTRNKIITPEEKFIRTGRVERNTNFNKVFRILSRLISFNWKKFMKKSLIEGIIRYPLSTTSFSTKDLYYNQLTKNELDYIRKSVSNTLDILIGFRANDQFLNEIMDSVKSMCIANLITSHEFSISREKALVFNTIIKKNPFLKVFSFSDGERIEIFLNKNFVGDVRTPVQIVSSYLKWKNIIKNKFVLSNIFEGILLARFKIGKMIIPRPSVYEFIDGFEACMCDEEEYEENFNKKGICLTIGRGIYDVERILGPDYTIKVIRRIEKGTNPIRTEINEIKRIYNLVEIARENKFYNRARRNFDSYDLLISSRLMGKPVYDTEFVKILELIKFENQKENI